MPEMSVGGYVFLPFQGVSYLGPGDAVPGALSWWGLRAYNANTIGSRCVQIQRASDSAVMDFVTLPNGMLDVNSINTFLASTTGVIAILYDQISSNHMEVRGIDPLPAYSAAGPGIVFIGPGAGATKLQSISPTNQTTPFTVPYVINPVNAGFSSILGDFDGFGTQTGVGSVDKTVYLYSGGGHGGSVQTAPISGYGVQLAVQAVFNGASSSLTVNGSTTAGLNPGTRDLSSQVDLNYPNPGNLTLYELGIWPGVFSAQNLSDMNANMRAFWNF